MLVKDELDVIGYTLEWLSGQVDKVIVADNGSTDGTRELVEEIADGSDIELIDDPEIAYYQSVKTTKLMRMAHVQGFDWVLPCDADEHWSAEDGRVIADYLAGVAPDVRVLKARLFNYFATPLDDPAELNPMQRICWRQREHQMLPKVCVRAGSDVTIAAGNHSASFEGYGMTVTGLVVRHYSWRSEEQYLRKIRNGSAAYAATTLDPTLGAHWRMFGEASDEAILEHYRKWFFYDDPEHDDSLERDQAPW